MIMTMGAIHQAGDAGVRDKEPNAWVIERRRHARIPGSWAIRWIVGEHMVVLETRALDASVHGLRLEIPLEGLSGLLAVGQRHRLEILVGGTAKRLTRVAEVRHVTDTSVGFLIEVALPMEELRRSPADPSRLAISHVPHRSPGLEEPK
jgi:hypothetical protein